MKTALMLSFMFMSQVFNIELAITPNEQATGLMYRKEWNNNSQGMLFVNTYPRRVSFWMKNTYLNMVIYYLDKDFNIIETHYPTPLDETGMPSKTDNIQYILELNPALENLVTKNWDEFSSLLKTNLNNQESQIQRLQTLR